MTITKQNIWQVIEVTMAGYMIISSCGKPLVLSVTINKVPDKSSFVLRPVITINKNTVYIK
ncbi:MAG: hypothetical protein H7334_09095 [Ferruginibacter sp.]|nr:hypothetical protein [Ferruginibacter sp.]